MTETKQNKPRWGRMIAIAAAIGGIIALLTEQGSKDLEHILFGALLGVMAFIASAVIIHTNGGCGSD